MSRGATYLGLLAALKQDEILREARRPRRMTQEIRPRRRRRVSAGVLRALRITRR
jgi:hypothetical protein